MNPKNHLESYFVPADQIKNDLITIDGGEFRHLHKVKRKRVGDQVQVTDGEGNFYTVQIEQIKATQALAGIVKTRRLVGEPLTAITLAQGLIRSQRMDWLVEKGTELGVRRFVPVQMDYCQVGASDLKILRWQRLAQSALKQCGRSFLPQIDEKRVVKDLVNQLPKPVIFAHPGVKSGVREVVRSLGKKRETLLRSVSLIVGPEGGFSEDEITFFREWGFHQVQLGARRLRSETAAITLVTLTLEALGEM